MRAASRILDGLREAIRFASAKPFKTIQRPDQCHECGGTLTLVPMRHSFYYVIHGGPHAGQGERLTCTIPVWCCDRCPASYRDHRAGDVINATINEHRERSPNGRC